MCAADKEFTMGRRKAAQCTVNKSPQEDFSVLREPLHISTKGVMQLVKCMQSGTTEVRSMLQYECEVILECKVCRSLFRGFMNFLAHKRVYCTELQQNVRLNVLMAEQKDDETIVVQPESPPDHNKCGGNTHSEFAPEDNDDDDDDNDESDSDFEDGPNQQQSRKGAIKLAVRPPEAGSDDRKENVDNTIQKQEDSACPSVLEQMQAGTFKGTSHAYKFYSDVAEETLEKQKTKKTSLLKLEPLKGTSKVLKQTIVHDVNAEETEAVVGDETKSKCLTQGDKDDDGDSADNEKDDNDVSEDDSNETAEGKVVSVEPTAATGPIHMSLRTRSAGAVATPAAQKLSKRDDCDIKTLTCLLCDTQYSSTKTLLFHMVSLHSEKRKYVCPTCQTTFNDLMMVSQHMRKVHHKSRAQVDKMQDALKRMSFTKAVDDPDQSVAKGSAGAKEAKPRTKVSPNTSCVRCGKRFSQKWRVNRHLLTCKASKKPKFQNMDRVLGVAESTTASIKFHAGFSLHKCMKCSKAFGRKSVLEKHLEGCKAGGDEECSFKSFGAKSVSDNVSGKLDVQSVLSDMSACTTRSKKNIGNQKTKMPSASHSNRTVLKMSAADSEKIESLIDEKNITCLRCHRKYSCNSNLHRHAARHLGWRRFKCKLCRFTAYNRSECKSHLGRVHVIDKSKHGEHIVDLNDTLSLPSNAISRVELRYAQSQTSNDSDGHSASMSGYNISTRKNKRHFDMNPVKRIEPMQVLCTRSGMHRKPTFAELTARESKASKSPPESESDDSNDQKEDVSERKYHSDVEDTNDNISMPKVGKTMQVADESDRCNSSLHTGKRGGAPTDDGKEQMSRRKIQKLHSARPTRIDVSDDQHELTRMITVSAVGRSRKQVLPCTADESGIRKAPAGFRKMGKIIEKGVTSPEKIYSSVHGASPLRPRILRRNAGPTKQPPAVTSTTTTVRGHAINPKGVLLSPLIVGPNKGGQYVLSVVPPTQDKHQIVTMTSNRDVSIATSSQAVALPRMQNFAGIQSLPVGVNLQGVQNAAQKIQGSGNIQQLKDGLQPMLLRMQSLGNLQPVPVNVTRPGMQTPTNVQQLPANLDIQTMQNILARAQQSTAVRNKVHVHLADSASGTKKAVNIVTSAGNITASSDRVSASGLSTTGVMTITLPATTMNKSSSQVSAITTMSSTAIPPMKSLVGDSKMQEVTPREQSQ